MNTNKASTILADCITFKLVKMRLSLLLIFVSMLGFSPVMGQGDPVLMTVDKEKVTKSEFEAIFRKNKKGDEVTKEELDEYLDLFVNFKLKVREAEELGLDTVSKFVKELSGYRKQLERPYLVDSDMNEELLKEAYERMKQEVRASHILIKVAADASPEDTLAAYKKAMRLRTRIVNGEAFEAVAKGKGGSDDSSVSKNDGDLGYFTALQMVYPFENAAFNMKVGELSQPVRTRYGYHLLKLVDKRDARGEIRAAHIMVKSGEKDNAETKANAEKKIKELYEKLKSGEDFGTLAKQHSDDKGSAQKNGELPWFGTGKMVEEFEDTAFNLKEDGSYSAPFQTKYGWHIVKRLEHKPLQPFAEIERSLKAKVQRDTRSQLSKNSFLAKLKKEYNYMEYPKNMRKIYKIVDTSIYSANWKFEGADAYNKELFVLDGKKYLQKDFINYLLEKQRKGRQRGELNKYIDERYAYYAEAVLVDYERSKLETKYPEFKALMKEYRDGILLFELTDKKVWSKAVKDSTGLEAYYEANKNNYMWGQRLDAKVYTCANAKIAKSVKKMLKKKKSDEEILAAINEDSQLNLKIESDLYVKKASDVVDQFEWKTGVSDNKTINDQVVFLSVKEVMAPAPKLLKEAKGLVTADYQNHLEAEWIKSLKGKYAVSVNKDVLYTIQ